MDFRVKKEQDKHSAILTLWIFALCIKQIIIQLTNYNCGECYEEKKIQGIYEGSGGF